MDIEKIWKAHAATTAGLPDVANVMEIKASNLTSPLKKMKKLLKTNMLWAVLFVILYAVILFYYPFWQIRLFIGVALIFNLWGIVSGWKLHRSINDDILTGSLMTELQRNRTALRSWMRVQTIVAVCVYPFCVCGGFMLGGVLGSGKTVELFMSKPVAWWALIICVIILTPVGYLAAKWMFKKSFGKIVTQLDEAILSLQGN